MYFCDCDCLWYECWCGEGVCIGVGIGCVVCGGNVDVFGGVFCVDGGKWELDVCVDYCVVYGVFGEYGL